MSEWNNGGNTLEKYKGFSVEQVRELIKPNLLPFAPLMMQVHGDFNFATVVRNANAFGAQECFYYGSKKRWDRRGAVGTYHYTDVHHLKTMDEILSLRSKYPHFVALDIIEGVSKSINDHVWEPGTLLFFGEEKEGLKPEILEICDTVLHIPQRGSVRSINVGTASGISMQYCMNQLAKE